MERLHFRDHLGYSVASIGDAISYTFTGGFLMFFLTTVVGLSPAMAGVLTGLGTLWDAFINPIAGFLSDRVHGRMGRRRPALLLFAIPLGLSIFLLFTALPLPAAVKPFYYGFLVLLFWTMFTSFFIPYCALGASYTAHYDDRTKLRLVASIFNTFGAIIAMSTPSVLTAFFMEQGLSLSRAWSLVGALMGTITSVTVFITFFASKKKDPPCPKPEGLEKIRLKAIFGEYLDLFRLQPLRYLVLSSVFSLIAYTMLFADAIYYFTYNLQLASGSISLCFLSRALLSLCLIPTLGIVTRRIDKKRTIYLFSAIMAVGMCLCRFSGSESLPMLVLLICMMTISTNMYWSLVPSMYYDICDYDRAMTGKERQGAIVSLQGLVEEFSAGIGSLLLGLLLQQAGFDGSKTVQPAEALSWIHTCTTILPALFTVIAALALIRYGITRESHVDLQRRIREREMLKAEKEEEEAPRQDA